MEDAYGRAKEADKCRVRRTDVGIQEGSRRHVHRLNAGIQGKSGHQVCARCLNGNW